MQFHFYVGSALLLRLVSCNCNPSTWEADTHQGYRASLSCMKPYLKTTITTKPNQKNYLNPKQEGGWLAEELGEMMVRQEGRTGGALFIYF